MTFDILVTARTAVASPSQSAGYHMRGVIEDSSGTTDFVGTTMISVLGEDDPTWDATVVANNTTDALVIRVIGAASTATRWVAAVRTAEVAQ